MTTRSSPPSRSTSCAQQQLWALGDDVEHVLAHRDPQRLVRLRGRVVGAGRAPDAGGTPARTLARAAACRRDRGPAAALPLFASVSVDELFRIAGRVAAGASSARDSAAAGGERCPTPFTCSSTDGSPRAGTRAPATHDRRAGGARVSSGAPGRADAPIDPDGRRRSDAGADGRRAAHAARGQHGSRARPVLDAGRTRRSRQRSSNVQSTGAAPELEQLAADGLQPIEKILALQRVPVFARIAADEMRRARRHRAHRDDDVAARALRRIRARLRSG